MSYLSGCGDFRHDLKEFGNLYGGFFLDVAPHKLCVSGGSIDAVFEFSVTFAVLELGEAQVGTPEKIVPHRQEAVACYCSVCP